MRMVQISTSVSVPGEDESVASSLKTTLSGNVITKSFATRNLYYEDNIKFSKKSVKMYNGQQNVLAGSVKYSKNASYIHNLTAVAYDSRGIVCDSITCTFQNDNDELYISAESWTESGKYKVVIYAGIGEDTALTGPQSGTMYQSNTSFTLTVEPGIDYISTENMVTSVVLSSKNVTFKASVVGYDYWYKKAKSQKFTYEIMGAELNEWGSYEVAEPAEKVKNNITVDKNGKVTIKKEYVVGTANDYTDCFAVIIRAADYEGNEYYTTKFVEIKGNAQTPVKMYLTNSSGSKISIPSNGELSAEKLNGARIIVTDQGGRDMTKYVNITPADNTKGTVGIYVHQDSYSGKAYLYVRKCGTVTLKATSKDGKKKTLSMKLTAKKPSPNKLVYKYPSITCDGMAIATKDSTWKDGVIDYGAPFKGVKITFSTGLKIDGIEYVHKNWYDWKYSTKGCSAKVSGNSWTVTPTAKNAELKVWLKDYPNSTWIFKFNNSKWGESYEKSPALKLVEGKLYSNKYSSQDEVEYVEYEEDGYEYSYTDIPYQSVTYSYDYLSVREIRYASVTKNAPWLSISHNREKRQITMSLSPGNDIKAGSYKYKFALYDEYGYLYCKPMTVTVKINKSSPVKVNASYTMNYSKGGAESVELKTTPKEFIPDFDTELMNANVGGKANDFNQYLELVMEQDKVTGEKTARIQFKKTVTAAQKEALKGKTLTGYVRYSYYYGYDHMENATSKISIKIQ